MYELLGAAVVAAYGTFVFAAERVGVYPVPSSHVAKRQYRHGRRWAIVVMIAVIAVLAWATPGGTLGVLLSTFSGLGLIVYAATNKLAASGRS